MGLTGLVPCILGCDAITFEGLAGMNYIVYFTTQSNFSILGASNQLIILVLRTPNMDIDEKYNFQDKYLKM